MSLKRYTHILGSLLIQIGLINWVTGNTAARAFVKVKHTEANPKKEFSRINKTLLNFLL